MDTGPKTVDDIIPKVIIAIAVIVAAALIGFGLAKLLDYIYDHSQVNDNASDMSENTKQMLKAHLVLQKMKKKKKDVTLGDAGGDEEKKEKKVPKLLGIVKRATTPVPPTPPKTDEEKGLEEGDAAKDAEKVKVTNECEVVSVKSSTNSLEKDENDGKDNKKDETKEKSGEDSQDGIKTVQTDDKNSQGDGVTFTLGNQTQETGHVPAKRTASDALGSVDGPSSPRVLSPTSPTSPRRMSSATTRREPSAKSLVGLLKSGRNQSTTSTTSTATQGKSLTRPATQSDIKVGVDDKK